jgi:hypothetical protein
VPPTPAQQARAAAIAAEITARLAGLPFALPGTLADRMTRCGYPGCRCHADPPQRHGPYHQWTRRKNGKTATRILSDDQLADYGPWFGNHRRLRELIAELEELSLAIAEADPRWNREPHRPARERSGQPAEPEQQPPDNVGYARLTCGQHLSHPTFAQVSAKRENLTGDDLGFVNPRSSFYVRYAPVSLPCLLGGRMLADGRLVKTG